MKKRLSALVMASLIGLMVVAVGLSFLFGFSNPVSWVLIALVVAIPVVYRYTTGSTRLEWREEYSVGVQQLDDDHKRLIELLNQFQTAYDYHTGDKFERAALNELVDYTRYHFNREEELMAANGYPELEAHQAEHRAMIAKVELFLADYQERGHDALQAIADYLREWLISHINGTDKRYGPFLNGKGVN